MILKDSLRSATPPGEAKGEVAGAGTIQFTYLFREQRGAKSPYHLQIGYSCNRRDNKTGSIDKTIKMFYSILSEFV